MFNKTKKHVFFIEGGDNVGKTTTIQNFKRTEFISNLKYNRLCFSKYPTLRATDNINRLMNEYKQLEDMKKDMDRHLYNTSKKEILHNIIEFMVSDMMFSFCNDNDIDQYIVNYPEDILNICDRGFISTYLYQYKNMPAVTKVSVSEDKELEMLKEFVDMYIPYSYNTLSVIILNNNMDTKIIKQLPTDETETIEYKKNFDNDTDLQRRINSTLNNIVKLIDQHKLDDLKAINRYKLTEIRPIRFYYINIFDSTGLIRKSPDEICEEILSIINKED